jgi:hypothetical protein
MRVEFDSLAAKTFQEILERWLTSSLPAGQRTPPVAAAPPKNILEQIVVTSSAATTAANFQDASNPYLSYSATLSSGSPKTS